MPKAHGRRRGYICIWGTSNREKVTDAEGIVIECPGCGQQTRIIGKSMTPYCSVFYIPLFPQGGGEPFIECSSCGGKFHGDIYEIKNRVANRQAELNTEIENKQQVYAANTSDVDTACELVELYMAADREDEGQQLAERLAHSQPDDANVQVMLARVCMHRDDMPRAFQVLQQAIAINPTHAGAQYHSAVALMSVDPPRIEEALACAEQAKAFGHPEARELIQAIESAKAPEA